MSVGRSDRGHLAPLLALLPEAGVYAWGCRSVSGPIEVVNRMGEAVQYFGDELSIHRPDLLVVFGDRWEQLAAATAASILGIPIVHLHAGETTAAVYDDGFRNAISAMATHHVAAAEPYAERLRQQGYRSVHCLGAPGLGRLKRPHLGVHMVKRGPVILVQFHPETRNLADIPRQVEELRAALSQLSPHAEIAWTEPGMDAGREHIIKGLAGFQMQRYTDEQWIDMLHVADVLVGNSSCGIIETPSIPLPSVNIGDRQRGRLMASSVICVPHDRTEIMLGIKTALDPRWREQHLHHPNP